MLIESWQSFFQGASAMFFVLLLFILLIRSHAMRREREKRGEAQERLYALWAKRLEQGEGRNKWLREIAERGRV